MPVRFLASPLATRSTPSRFFNARLALCLMVGLVGWADALPAESVATIETVAGTGRSIANAVGASLDTNIGQPFGVELGPDNALYITEVSNHRVFRLDRATGQLSVVAGNGRAGYDGDGGPAVEARLNEPYEVRFDRHGHMFIVEMQNHVVRRIDRHTGVITTVAGTGEQGFGGDGGPATQAQLNRPHSIVLDTRGRIYIADIGNHRIRAVDETTGRITSLAGNGQRVLPIDQQTATGTPVLGPRALYMDRDDRLWVALREGHSIWRLDLVPDGAIWHHVAGTGHQGYAGDGGQPALAMFNGPKGLAMGPDEQLYVVDTENQVIRRIDLRRNLITTVAGRGPRFRGFGGDHGNARDASLNRPHGICVDTQGRLFIGDSENHRVRMVSPPGLRLRR